MDIAGNITEIERRLRNGATKETLLREYNERLSKLDSTNQVATKERLKIKLSIEHINQTKTDRKDFDLWR